jgi:hypothetical protein
MTSEDRAATPSGGAVVTFDRDDESEYEYVESVGGHYDSLLVVGHGRIVAPKHEIWVAPESVVSAADIASLHATAYERGEIDVIGARHLIRAGRAHLLTGLAESGWLEVKGGPYRLSAQGAEGTRAAVELAQDVARFANGDCDS